MAEAGSGMQTFLYTNPESALTNRALIEAFERAGLQSISQNGGLGIRLRHPFPVAAQKLWRGLLDGRQT